MSPQEGTTPGRRIWIRGVSGAGKTTLGKALAERYQIPHTQLDALYHQPNWTQLEPEEFRRVVAEVVDQEEWVIDGNYSAVADLALARAETVLWLDYPLPIVLWRVASRSLRRGIVREEMWNGNRESLFRNFLTRDSIILWVLTTHRRRRAQAIAFLADPAYSHIESHHFRHPRETAEWLDSVS